MIHWLYIFGISIGISVLFGSFLGTFWSMLHDGSFFHFVAPIFFIFILSFAVFYISAVEQESYANLVLLPFCKNYVRINSDSSDNYYCLDSNAAKEFYCSDTKCFWVKE